MNKKEERDDYVFMQSVCQKRCLFDVSFPFLLFTFKLWHWGQREYEHLQKALFLHLSLLYLRLLNVVHCIWFCSRFIVLHNYFIIRNNIMLNMCNIEMFWTFDYTGKHRHFLEKMKHKICTKFKQIFCIYWLCDKIHWHENK